jgi:hypothetical protein
MKQAVGKFSVQYGWVLQDEVIVALPFNGPLFIFKFVQYPANIGLCECPTLVDIANNNIFR